MESMDLLSGTFRLGLGCAAMGHLCRNGIRGEASRRDLQPGGARRATEVQAVVDAINDDLDQATLDDLVAPRTRGDQPA
jgi:hypothetical protein